MRDTKSGLLVFAFAMAPYLAVAWGYTHFVGDGSQREFWVALGVLLAIRLFFSVIETLGGVLAWRLYHKKRMVTAIVQVLRANKFPPKQRETDSFSGYLARIVRDYEPKPDFLRAAKEFEAMIILMYEFGSLPGWRYSAAADAALEIYAPVAAERASGDDDNDDGAEDNEDE